MLARTMGCVGETKLSEYLAGMLGPQDAAQVATHLESCQSCKQRAFELVELASGRTQAQSTPQSGRGGAGRSSRAEGDKLGRYIVLGRLGVGGMGEVYSAYDPELNRKLAIKLLRTDMAGADFESARTRLLEEAQTLAQVSHPNVVAVHDVGLVDGEVFVAMDFIEGDTLDEWLLRSPRTWREVVAVFRQCAEGLVAAHNRQIIHLDFKPQNVLIAPNGRVFVVDFGLARAGGRASSGELVGTVLYMSPEQFTGASLDGRSDQFSFCVSLYEALHRQRPFLGDGGALHSAIASGNVREPPPGTKVPAWIHRVLLQGLRADPAKRFPSMQALLDALGRDPVAARRRWVSAGAAVALACAAAFVTHALNARQSLLCKGAERKLEGVWDPARKERIAQAFAATRTPYTVDAWKAVEQALDGYAGKWAAMHADSCEATRLRGEQSEEVQALRMGCLQQRLAEFRSLSDLFASADSKVVEKSVQAAQALSPLRSCAEISALQASIKPPADSQVAAEVDRLRASLARFKALDDAGRYADGLKGFEAVLAEVRRTGYQPLVAEALFRFASLQTHSESFKAARVDALDAAFAAEASRDDELLVRAFTLLVQIDTKLQSLDLAQVWGRLSRAGLERLGGRDDLEVALEQATSRLWWIDGKYPEALTSAQKALAVAERSGGDGTAYASATALNDVGHAYSLLGDYANAVPYLERAIRAMERLLGPQHPELAAAHQFLVQALRGLGRSEEAFLHARRAFEITEQALGGEHPRAAAAMVEMAHADEDLEKWDEALGYSRRGLAIAEKAFGPEHVLVENARRALATELTGKGEYAHALEELERVKAIDKKIRRPDHPVWAYVFVEEGSARMGLGDYAAASGLLEKALEMQTRQAAGADDIAMTRFRLARALWDGKRDRPRAIALAGQARESYAKLGNEREAGKIAAWETARPGL